MSLFPKPGQGYAGVGSVPDEDIDAKCQEYTNILLQQPQKVKDLYCDSDLDPNGNQQREKVKQIEDMLHI